MFFYKKKRKHRGKNNTFQKKSVLSKEQMEMISNSIIRKKRLVVYVEKN